AGPSSAPRRSESGRSRRLALGATVLFGLAGAAILAIVIWQQPTKIAPYSAQDRRMTFAVLPFIAPAGDEAAPKVAAGATEAATRVQEGKTRWAGVAPRASVAQAVAKYAATKDIAKALDVHFLIRGTVSRAAEGYNAELLVLDGETEHSLGRRGIAIPA